MVRETDFIVRFSSDIVVIVESEGNIQRAVEWNVKIIIN